MTRWIRLSSCRLFLFLTLLTVVPWTLAGSEALSKAGLNPIELGPKEGLALINGTQFSTAYALAGLFEAQHAAHTALVSSSLSIDAAKASTAPLLEEIHALRGHPGQIDAAATMRALLDHFWPGNVRELAHAIEHAVLVADGEKIEPEDLPSRVCGDASAAASADLGADGQAFREARQVFERAYFSNILKRADGKIGLAARLAGIHRTTFHKKLGQLGLDSGTLSEE